MHNARIGLCSASSLKQSFKENFFKFIFLNRAKTHALDLYIRSRKYSFMIIFVVVQTGLLDQLRVELLQVHQQ